MCQGPRVETRPVCEGTIRKASVSKGHALGPEVPWVVRAQATHSLIGHCVDAGLDPECKWNFIPGRDVNLTSLYCIVGINECFWNGL